VPTLITFAGAASRLRLPLRDGGIPVAIGGVVVGEPRAPPSRACSTHLHSECKQMWQKNSREMADLFTLSCEYEV